MRYSMLPAFAMLAVASLTAACETIPATAAPGVERTEDEAAIRAILDGQDEAWNAGDIDGFMDGYWQSPELRFASGGTIVRGYQPTLDRYKARYSSPQKMGKLDTRDLEIVFLSADAAVVHGTWELIRENDAPGGLFTLILRRLDGQWKIISDTTTSAD